jgi:agmatinase
LLLPFGNAARSLEIIGEFVRGVLDDGKMPVGLGGEHLVSWPVFQEVYKKYPDLAIIHFDAHADLREQYEGEPLSHSTPLRKAAGLMGGKNIYQFGIRSGSREEFQYARENINFHPFEVLEPLKKVLPELAGRPVYLTIDIDVLDPSAAPGTGTAEAGGITSKELIEAVHAIARSGVNVVGCDLVEVAPAYDPTEQTQIVAAKVIREMLLGFLK